MRIPENPVALAVLCAGGLLNGCHHSQERPPFAPGLRGPIDDLTAIRVADEISLAWTMPRKHVDKFAAHSTLAVQVCRRERLSAACVPAGAPVRLASGAAGRFSEQLPEMLEVGAPRVVYYSIDLLDRNGRPTGLSKSVPTLAGAPPPALQGLTAELAASGVILLWRPVIANDGRGTAMGERHTTLIVRLHRFEIVDRRAEAAQRDGAGLPIAATLGVDLNVAEDAQTGRTVDTGIERGKSYRYFVRQVAQIRVGDRILEMAGQLSNAAEIDTASSAAQ